MRILLIQKNKPWVDRRISVNHAIFCPIPGNPSQNTLCPGVYDRIVETVNDVLIRNVIPQK